MPNREEGMIADYDFVRGNYSGGWKSKGGRGDTLNSSNDKFDWTYDTVPSNVDYDSESLFGQLKATETLWNGVTCRDPETS